MSLTEDKAVPAPLKNMDIKSAFLAASSRKRKAVSPTLQKNLSKNLKLADDKEDVIIDVTENADSATIGDCKENTDLNTAEAQNVLQHKGKNSLEHSNKDKKLVSEVISAENSCKEKNIASENTVSSENSCKVDKELSFESTETLKNSSQESMSEDSDSSNELNSSNLNNSINVGELSENVEDSSKNQHTLNSSVSCDKVKSENNPEGSADNNQNDKQKKKKKMTAEEAKLRAEEREQKHKERLLKKQELEALRKQKKDQKEKLKLQKEQEKREKEEERKEKERLKQEKKEQEEKERLQKLKEKEESKKQRQLLLEMKLEEKKRKEEMRLKREEEIKKAEEEKRKAKLEKEQKEKEKNERAKAAFFKFFTKGVTITPTAQVSGMEGVFKPFQVSDDMTLAPVVPAAAQERFNKEQLDHALQFQDCKKLYLQILKSGNYKDVKLRKRLRKQRMCDADVIVLDKKAAAELFLTAKLLQFCENVRPPYWGTWRKQSKKIGPRRPFGMDEIFDYEVDSDDEWDEGGPGESLSGTENEVESEDDYEVDNEFFVPHGYLSPEEEKEDDEANTEMVNDPEKQKAILKLKLQEFESERKKKTTELKPIILGCFFENGSALQDNGLHSFLLAYCAELISDTPILTNFTVKKSQSDSAVHSNTSSPSANNASKKGKAVPEEAMPHLIRLLHGNVNGRDTLIKEFQTFWQNHCQNVSEEIPSEKLKCVNIPTECITSNADVIPDVTAQDSRNISKRQLILSIKKISTYGKSPNPAVKKACWWVHEDVLEKYGLLNAPIPNEWVSVSASTNENESSPIVKNCTSIKEFLIP
ncbi:chromatin assembly factor 1 subunit A [Trichonephila clavata]|uniref:Chromatin assembly factor 1 subunit A n=1 Tax=Trichonephila clavata TaxID=2740835 RepID=A0A8X6L998_TRICU|nr:chromatin assembly factor 1 subunit A [Trichonephila clavata]